MKLKIKKYIHILALATALHCWSTLPTLITIKSCNVLHEKLYQTYAKQVKKMDPDHRKHLLLHAFIDPNQFANADIICLQEWDTLDNDLLSNALTKNDYAHYCVSCNDYDRPDGLIVAWKKDIFQLYAAPTIYSFEDTRSPIQSRRALGIALRHIATNTIIYVISIHASFIYGYEKRYESVLEQLNTIKNDVSKHASNSTFICGDLNYNIHSKNSTHYPNHELEQTEAETLYAKILEDGWQDATSTTLASRHPTTFGYTGYELLDYILFKGDVHAVVETSWYPKDLKQLIKHTLANHNEGPDFDNYFSDHAIISATFDIKQSH